MSTPAFELIILENGDIGLQRSGVDETLVQVKFSSKVKKYLGEQHIEVAKQMIDSGIQAVIDWEQAETFAEQQKPSKTVH
jgi:citrate lyase gamma subunit